MAEIGEAGKISNACTLSRRRGPWAKTFPGKSCGRESHANSASALLSHLEMKSLKFHEILSPMHADLLPLRPWRLRWVYENTQKGYVALKKVFLQRAAQRRSSFTRQTSVLFAYYPHLECAKGGCYKSKQSCWWKCRAQTSRLCVVSDSIARARPSNPQGRKDSFAPDALLTHSPPHSFYETPTMNSLTASFRWMAWTLWRNIQKKVIKTRPWVKLLLHKQRVFLRRWETFFRLLFQENWMVGVRF